MSWIKITFFHVLWNINYFYTTLQKTITKVLDTFNGAGIQVVFYLVNNVIKACEIGDLYRWKTWFQKWCIITNNYFQFRNDCVKLLLRFCHFRLFIFTIFSFNSYKNKNASLNYSVYNSVAFFSIFSEFTISVG